MRVAGTRVTLDPIVAAFDAAAAAEVIAQQYSSVLLPAGRLLRDHVLPEAQG